MTDTPAIPPVIECPKCGLVGTEGILDCHVCIVDAPDIDDIRLADDGSGFPAQDHLTPATPDRARSSAAERGAHNADVAGSTPAGHTTLDLLPRGGAAGTTAAHAHEIYYAAIEAHAREIYYAAIEAHARASGKVAFPPSRVSDDGSRVTSPSEYIITAFAAALTAAERAASVSGDEIKRLQAVIERDRTNVAKSVSAVRDAIRAHEWLRLGRGSYEYNDDRWRDEFGAAFDAIEAVIYPLSKIATDRHDSPVTAEEIAAARAPVSGAARERERANGPG